MDTAEKYRNKRLHYKRIELENHSEIVPLLHEALQGPFEKPATRKEEVADGVVRLLNRSVFQGEYLVAELICFEAGQAVQFIEMNADGNHYPLRIHPNDDKNKERLDSAAYFCMLSEHLLVLTSKSFSMKDMEAHLSWLLRKIIRKSEVNLTLTDLPGEELEELERAEDYVKSVNLGGDVSIKESKTDTLELGSNLANTVLNALNPEGFSGFLTENPDEWSRVKVKIAVNYSRPRKNAEIRPELIKMLAPYKNIDDISITTKNGRTLKGDQIRLSIPIKVKIVNGAVDFEVLVKNMHSGMEEAIKIAYK